MEALPEIVAVVDDDGVSEDPIKAVAIAVSFERVRLIEMVRAILANSESPDEDLKTIQGVAEYQLAAILGYERH